MAPSVYILSRSWLFSRLSFIYTSDMQFLKTQSLKKLSASVELMENDAINKNILFIGKFFFIPINQLRDTEEINIISNTN